MEMSRKLYEAFDGNGVCSFVCLYLFVCLLVRGVCLFVCLFCVHKQTHQNTQQNTGLARFDIREEAKTGKLYVLDINPNPSLFYHDGCSADTILGYSGLFSCFVFVLCCVHKQTCLCLCCVFGL